MTKSKLKSATVLSGLYLSVLVGSFHKAVLSSPVRAVSVSSQCLAVFCDLQSLTSVLNSGGMHQSPQKQRITQQICRAMTSLLLRPAGTYSDTGTEQKNDRFMKPWRGSMKEIVHAFGLLVVCERTSSLEEDGMKTVKSRPHYCQLVVGPLAGVSGTCRAFRECGWEDGHNFQTGNRRAQLQQTEGV